MTNFAKFFEGKNVLITGGTGSLGHVLTDILLEFDIKSLRVMSRHEDLQVQMRRDYGDKRINFLLGDVRDYQRCITATRNIDVVIHAAALKHVSYIEGHVSEAMKTNVTGTYNMKQASIDSNVQNFLYVSTDKAVKPINAYGMSKAIGERIVLNHEDPSNTKFSVVRYGNIVGSRGSVIPLWHSLAKQGKNLSVTDRRMTRFWLTLDEAVELIFTSLQKPNKMVVKRCKGLKTIDLANLYAKKFNVKIEDIGMRAGEKIDEALLSDYEYRKAASEDSYFIVDYDAKDQRNTLEDFTSANAEQLTHKEMISILTKEGYYD